MSKGSWTDDPYGSSDEDFTTLYPISDDRGAAASATPRLQSDAQRTTACSMQMHPAPWASRIVYVSFELSVWVILA